MEKQTEIRIRAKVRTIKQDITNGNIFGEKVDLNNTDMVIVAAYYLGWTDCDPEFKRYSIARIGKHCL